MKLNTKLSSLPTTQTLINSYKLSANKKLGQNFLLDSNITDNIILKTYDLKDKIVLEIGPGPGGLTRSILTADVKKLIAIEFDDRCIPLLNQIASLDPRLEVMQADALNFDEKSLGYDKLTIISNLPYNIGTALLLKWLKAIDLFDQIVIMLQKEVVERILGEPGSKEYGRISILCQTICECDLIEVIPAYNFFPEPKVDSAVVRLIPKKDINVNLKLLQLICQNAFAQRRKQIKTTLKKYLNQAAFDYLGIDSTLRAENLSINDYHRITNYIDKNE